KDFAAQLRVIHQLPPPSMLESLNFSAMPSSPWSLPEACTVPKDERKHGAYHPEDEMTSLPCAASLSRRARFSASNCCRRDRNGAIISVNSASLNRGVMCCWQF